MKYNKVVVFLLTVALPLLSLAGCWSKKQAEGLDFFNVSPVSLEEDRVDSRMNFDEESEGAGHIFVTLSKKLRDNLLPHKTTYDQVVQWLGPPTEANYQPNQITLIYDYHTEWNAGYYKLSTRKVEGKGKIDYRLVINCRAPHLPEVTPVFYTEEVSGSPSIYVTKGEKDGQYKLKLDDQKKSLNDLKSAPLQLTEEMTMALRNGADPRDFFTVVFYELRLEAESENEDKIDPLQIGERFAGGAKKVGKAAAGAALP